MADTSADKLLTALVAHIADAVVQRLADRLPTAAQSADADLLDGPAMAKRLGISLPTLDRMRAAGKIPFIRLGRRVLFQLDAVLAALSQQGGQP